MVNGQSFKQNNSYAQVTQELVMEESLKTLIFAVHRTAMGLTFYPGLAASHIHKAQECFQLEFV